MANEQYGYGNTENSMEQRKKNDPDPIHPSPPTVDTEQAKIRPCGVEEGFNHQALLYDAVCQTQNKDCGPALTPAKGDLSSQDGAAAIEGR